MESEKVKLQWLQGIRVVLIGHYVPGPLAAYLLGMLGAEVIKVEQDKGDYLRMMQVQTRAGAADLAPMFRMLNGGFKSFALQWRQPEGAEILGKLIATADVVIDGGRLGALEKALGTAPEQLSDRLIYIPITAYGQVGPMAQLAGHDNNILALAGNLSYTQTSAEGLPTVFSAPVADMFAGQMAAFGALAALLGRERIEDGPKRLDASMLHAGFFLNFLELAARNGNGQAPPQAGKAWMNGGRPDYRPYRCADGRFIYFGLLEAWSLKRFLEGIGRGDLLLQATQPVAFAAGLAALFLEKTQAEWVALGAIHDACITAVQDLEQAVHDPQVQALGLVQTVADPEFGPLELPTYPLGFGPRSLQPALPASAPRLGQDTREILASVLGMASGEIESLAQKGIVILG